MNRTVLHFLLFLMYTCSDQQAINLSHMLRHCCNVSSLSFTYFSSPAIAFFVSQRVKRTNTCAQFELDQLRFAAFA